MEGKFNHIFLSWRCVVEYWRNRYQRMNTERFFAANTIALITHTIVSIHLLSRVLLDATPWSRQNQIANAPGRKGLCRHWIQKRNPRPRSLQWDLCCRRWHEEILLQAWCLLYENCCLHHCQNLGIPLFLRLDKSRPKKISETWFLCLRWYCWRYGCWNPIQSIRNCVH